MRSLAAAAALALALLGGAAHAADTGTLVVRLVTDPTPAGVTWTYAGAGSAFRLGTGTAARRTVSLPVGSYHLEETPTTARPDSLTAVACTPTHDAQASVATATATVALAAGETVTCTFTHRALGPHPAASAVALAARFAPTLRLSAAEHYRPIAMQDYLAHATLRSGTAPLGKVVQRQPTLFSLPVGGGSSYLDVRGPQPFLHASQYRTIEQALERARRPTVYWRIAHQPSTGRLAIEYWFLYLYNDFVDRHEADWEGVTVVVDNGAPLGVSSSQHQGRTWSSWPATITDDHPVVYVAAGSHANYPAPGSYLLGIGLTRDRVVDPRRRTDYSNPFAAVPAGM